MSYLLYRSELNREPGITKSNKLKTGRGKGEKPLYGCDVRFVAMRVDIYAMENHAGENPNRRTRLYSTTWPCTLQLHGNFLIYWT